MFFVKPLKSDRFDSILIDHGKKFPIKRRRKDDSRLLRLSLAFRGFIVKPLRASSSWLQIILVWTNCSKHRTQRQVSQDTTWRKPISRRYRQVVANASHGVVLASSFPKRESEKHRIKAPHQWTPDTRWTRVFIHCFHLIFSGGYKHWSSGEMAKLDRLSVTSPHVNSVQRRNERERRRVHLVNEGFASLRERLPNGTASQKLSKVETLRCAVNYILQLQSLLSAVREKETDSCPSSYPAFEPPSSKNASGEPVRSWKWIDERYSQRTCRDNQLQLEIICRGTVMWNRFGEHILGLFKSPQILSIYVKLEGRLRDPRIVTIVIYTGHVICNLDSNKNLYCSEILAEAPLCSSESESQTEFRIMRERQFPLWKWMKLSLHIL